MLKRKGKKEKEKKKEKKTEKEEKKDNEERDGEENKVAAEIAVVAFLYGFGHILRGTVIFFPRPFYGLRRRRRRVAGARARARRLRYYLYEAVDAFVNAVPRPLSKTGLGAHKTQPV